MEARFVGVAGGRLHTRAAGDTDHDDLRDAARPQRLDEPGTDECAPRVFGDDDVAGLGSELIDELGGFRCDGARRLPGVAVGPPGGMPATLTITTGRSCARKAVTSSLIRSMTCAVGCGARSSRNAIPRCMSMTISAVIGSRVVMVTMVLLACASTRRT